MANEHRFRMGILDFCFLHDDQKPRDRLRHSIDLIKFADKQGFSRYWISEHHGTSVAQASPEVFTPILLENTKRISAGPAGILLNYYSPFKVAECFRLLGALYPGRVDLGLGRGSVDPAMAEALRIGSPNLSYDERVADLVGHLRRDLPEDHPHHELSAAPVETGDVDVWILGSGQGSVPLAAESPAAFSFGMFLKNSLPPHDTLRAYEESFLGIDAFPRPKMNVTIAGTCKETDKEVDRVTSAHTNGFIQVNVAGTPDSCREQILDIVRSTGVDEIVFAAVDQDIEDRATTYELLAKAMRFESGAIALPA